MPMILVEDQEDGDLVPFTLPDRQMELFKLILREVGWKWSDSPLELKGGTIVAPSENPPEKPNEAPKALQDKMAIKYQILSKPDMVKCLDCQEEMARQELLLHMYKVHKKLQNGDPIPKKSSTSSGKKPCPYCSRMVGLKGYMMHINMHKRRGDTLVELPAEEAQITSLQAMLNTSEALINEFKPQGENRGSQ